MTGNRSGRQQQPGSGRNSVLGFMLCCALIVAGAISSLALAQTGNDGNPGADAPNPNPNLVGHGGPVHAIQFNADKTRALTGSFDYSMMLWDISGEVPTELRRFDDHEGWVKAVAFLPDGRRALAAGGGHVYVWDLETGEKLHVLEGHTAEISALALTDDSKWAATASSDRTVRLWEMETFRPGPVLKGHRGPVNGVAFSADHKTVYSASNDGTIRSWDSTTGAFKQILYKHGFGINALRRLPGDKDLLVFGALNGKAHVVDPAAGKSLHQFEDNLGPYLAIDVQEKPGLLALSGFQKKGGAVVGIIRVMRLGDWAPIETYEDPRGPIWTMAFGQFGSTIYYGGKDDYVTVWQVSPRKPFESVTGPVPRRYEKVETKDPGELQFARKCSLCHTLSSDGGNRAGPTLYKVFGRKAGTLPGYPYSDALKNADIVWNEKTIGLLFGLGPDHYTPGTKMPLQKIDDPKTLNALIAYLKVATRGDGKNDARKNDTKHRTVN